MAQLTAELKVETEVEKLQRKIRFSSDFASSKEDLYYKDAIYEYKHAIIPSRLLKLKCVKMEMESIQKKINSYELLNEKEWKDFGVQMSNDWQHYMYHSPEPHVLLFRRPLSTCPVTGKLDPELEADSICQKDFCF